MILMERELQSVLHDALPHRYIHKMKESNQQPLWINYATLRDVALNIEDEAVANPGVQSDNEGDNKGNSARKKKSERIRKKRNRWGGNKNNNNKKYILEGSQSTVCSFCGITGDTEPECLKKKRAARDAKEQKKEHENKKWPPNRGGDDRGTPDKESFNFAQQFTMFSHFEEYQKFQNSQKKAPGKSKNSDKFSDSEASYL
jgi:hypothetical protein